MTIIYKTYLINKSNFFTISYLDIKESKTYKQVINAFYV